MTVSTESKTVSKTGLFEQFHYRQRTFKLYIPSGYQTGTPLPLIVMLHGCSQDPDDFARGTGMNKLAEEQTFAVLYPLQTQKANPKKCWNWFRRENQQRGQGEPAEIVALINQIARAFTLDQGRIYVVGLSAGGALAIVLAATYPDVFAAAGVCAGMPYQAATNAAAGIAAMQRGSRARGLGRAVAEAMGEHRRVVPLIMFQGLADKVVRPVNADLLIRQWLETDRLVADGLIASAEPRLASVVTSQSRGGYDFTRRIYEGPDGLAVLEAYLVEDMGHAWPGGSPTGSFTDPAGPDASALIVTFCLAHPMVEATALVSVEVTPPRPIPVEVGEATKIGTAPTPVQPTPVLEEAPATTLRGRLAAAGRTARRLLGRLFG